MVQRAEARRALERVLYTSACCSNNVQVSPMSLRSHRPACVEMLQQVGGLEICGTPVANEAVVLHDVCNDHEDVERELIACGGIGVAYKLLDRLRTVEDSHAPSQADPSCRESWDETREDVINPFWEASSCYRGMAEPRATMDCISASSRRPIHKTPCSLFSLCYESALRC